MRALIELDAELGTAVRRSFVGEVRPVLWENPEHTDGLGAPAPASEKPAHGDAVIWSGLTDNYLRVLAAAPAKLDLHNRITLVRLERLEGDALWGAVTTT